MNNIDRVVNLCLDAGQSMLESNCEIYRAEDVMLSIFNAYGYDHVNIFILATCIYVTVEVDEKSITKLRRVRKRVTNVTKMASINQLSREIKNHQISIDQSESILKEIKKHQQYPMLIKSITISLSCAVFGKMFVPYASGIDFVITFCITFLSWYLLNWINQRDVNELITNAIVAGFMCLCASMMMVLGVIKDIDTIIIGTIMMLVPGVLFTTAVRDLMNGDILSGTIRIIEGLLISLGIAIGVGGVLYLLTRGGIV